jgi:hypothetical protein
MARGRVRNRLELREQAEAAEAREQEQRVQEGDSDAGEVETADVEVEEGEEAAKPAAKKRKKKAPSTEVKPKRRSAAKATRQRLVWIVFDNSHKPIQSFDASRRTEAEELAVRLQTEKKSTHFVQSVKEDMKE